MNPNITILVCKLFVAFLAYTLILAAAQRALGQRGHNAAAAFMSALWWLGLDAGVMLLSFFLTVTAYRSWFPSEPLALSEVFGRWFANTALSLSDMMAFFFTALAFSLAHKLVYEAMLLRQELTEGAFGASRELALHALGPGILLGAYLYFLLQWEGAVLALRVAELMGSEEIADAVAEVTSISSVAQIVGQSWLLRTLLYIWTGAILFVSWGFVRAFVRLENAIAELDAPQAEQSAPEGAAETAPQFTAQGTAGVQQTAEVRNDGEQAAATPQSQPAQTTPQPQIRVVGVPEVEALAQPHTAMTGGNGGNGNGGSNGGADRGEVQTLINQIEEERQRRELLEQERDALTMTQARNPLWQPNRATVRDVWLEDAVEGENQHE
jgi:hypothetical protein